MKINKRILAVILAVLLLIAMVSSTLYLAAEAGHDCAGEDCPVCTRMEACLNTFKVLSWGLTLLAVCLTLAHIGSRLAASTTDPARPNTPVLLKVKLLN